MRELSAQSFFRTFDIETLLDGDHNHKDHNDDQQSSDYHHTHYQHDHFASKAIRHHLFNYMGGVNTLVSDLQEQVSQQLAH